MQLRSRKVEPSNLDGHEEGLDDDENPLLESDDVDERGEGEKGWDDTLVDTSELCEVPGIGHHNKIAHINSRVSEKRHQVRPLQFAIWPDQTRVFGISPSAIFDTVDDDSDRPKKEENDEHTRST